LRLLVLVAREGFLKDNCGPRAKKFEHHWSTSAMSNQNGLLGQKSCHSRPGPHIL